MTFTAATDVTADAATNTSIMLPLLLSLHGCICQIFTGGGSEFRLATSDYSGHGGCQIGTVYRVVEATVAYATLICTFYYYYY